MAATSAPRGSRRSHHCALPRPSGRQALRALGSSALALLGTNHARADGRSEDVFFEYHFATYTEDELPVSKGLPGSPRDRFEVSTQQILMRAPVIGLPNWDFGTTFVMETMSGATPWYTVPDAAGTPIQFMSGATVDEKRNELQLTASRYSENGRMGFGTGYSSENDYKALSLSMDGETHFNEKNTTLSGGWGVSLDSIDPVDREDNPTRPGHKTKKTYSLFTGLSQIIDRRSFIDSSLTYRFGRGYLSDPYKEVFVLGGIFLPDSRPSSRHQLAWLTRYRRHVEELGGSFHIDYQYGIDTWGIDSHTLEISWWKTFRDKFTFVPSLRWYSQSQADFYVAYFNDDPGPGDYSSDYRLSAFGAVSFGIAGEYRFRTRWTRNLEWQAKFSWERYFSSADLSHASGSESPGLLNWNMLSIGLAVRF